MPSTVLIGANDVMPALREQLEGGADALSFADSEPLEALKAITAHRPPLIVLERLFAATPRGAALINRIKSDPSLTHVEVRVVSHTGDYVRTVSRPAPVATTAPVAVAAEPPAAAEAAPTEPNPLDWHGTRRAPRIRVREDVQIHLDGNAARVVDLSVIGAQALCPRSLRPDQKIRVAITSDNEVRRFRASVAWARFELARPPAQPHYRVGVEFVDADADWLELFCDKVKA
jgi:CheY-like chemotaxis protein